MVRGPTDGSPQIPPHPYLLEVPGSTTTTRPKEILKLGYMNMPFQKVKRFCKH